MAAGLYYWPSLLGTLAMPAPGMQSDVVVLLIHCGFIFVLGRPQTEHIARPFMQAQAVCRSD